MNPKTRLLHFVLSIAVLAFVAISMSIPAIGFTEASEIALGRAKGEAVYKDVEILRVKPSYVSAIDHQTAKGLIHLVFTESPLSEDDLQDDVFDGAFHVITDTKSEFHIEIKNQTSPVPSKGAFEGKLEGNHVEGRIHGSVDIGNADPLWIYNIHFKTVVVKRDSLGRPTPDQIDLASKSPQAHTFLTWIKAIQTKDWETAKKHSSSSLSSNLKKDELSDYRYAEGIKVVKLLSEGSSATLYATATYWHKPAAARIRMVQESGEWKVVRLRFIGTPQETK